MNDAVADRLREIIHRFGVEVIDDPRRCEALLCDLCGQHRREIQALVAALKLRIPRELVGSTPDVPYAILEPRLVRRLLEDTPLAEGVVRWTVWTWGRALGVAPVQPVAIPLPSWQWRTGQVARTFVEWRAQARLPVHRHQAEEAFAQHHLVRWLETIGNGKNLAQVRSAANLEQLLNCRSMMLHEIFWPLLVVGIFGIALVCILFYFPGNSPKLGNGVKPGQELCTLKGHSGGVISVAISPDGKHIVSGSDDHTVKVWDDGRGQEVLSLKGHASQVSCVAVSPDGKRIVSGSEDRTVKIWDAQTGQEILSIKGHTHWVHSVCFSPDCMCLASSSLDATIKIWDAQTGQEILSIKGHTGHVYSVCFSPDGKRLASASEDQMAKVWDAQTGQEILSIRGHTSQVYSACYSPDGARLASASHDGTVKVWDAGKDSPGRP